ncbi:hypothetical protein AXF42_Ash015363 [Apostasia shenzhenica]|uniref:Calmodulin-binding protein 60 B n=1 Tax=Apostasia shenzhenica TaxID=1088818 RepID=A0A2I0AM04_9ASPA|nr:hypothetical protein AXF42_Ash015363 [Apostasia shenzhenica]
MRWDSEMQRPGRHLERQVSMTREKRAVDPVEDMRRERKRPKLPALASVIVEALKLDCLQKLGSSLEPILRRIVSEEVERALAKLGSARLGGRSSPKRIEGSDERNLQLHFRTRLSLPLFTGGRVGGEEGGSIHVVLIDASTGHVITAGPESSSKLDVVVLEGDFNNEDDDNWAEEEFESHVVKEREGKRSLLTGDLQLSLKEGVGTLGELTFTDNSSWIRSRKFRLGLKIASGSCDGIRVLYKKHYPPVLKDEVWRLEKIGKDGSFHKRLNKSGICTVEDFLRHFVRDCQRLRTILGSGMSNKMWESLVEHAKTCVLSRKYYVYYSDDARSVGAVFNNIYEFSGLIAGGQYYSAGSLGDGEKVFVDALVKKAYDNWSHVLEYDGKALVSFKQNKKISRPPVPANYSSLYDKQISSNELSAAVPKEHSALNTQVTTSSPSNFNDKYDIRFSGHFPQHLHYENVAFSSQNQSICSPNHNQIARNNGTSLALTPPPHSSSAVYPPLGQPSQPESLNGHERRFTDDFISEEIRMKSHEMLENEDMQHMLRVLSMGGGYADLSGGSFGFSSMPSPYPNFGFDEDRNRSSSKAVVGWLKIKAAMRWGIFIRKKAAERRAQLVVIED